MVRTLIAACAAAAAVSGCQRVEPGETHDPLAPIRQIRTVASLQLDPNLMIVVDTSESMNLPAVASHPACPAGCGTSGAACPAACPTRLSEVVSGLSTFVDQRVRDIRVGLAALPTSGEACALTTQGEVRVPLAIARTDVASEQLADVAAVKASLQNLVASGSGTGPAALRFLADYPPLNDPEPARRRQNFVILVTDGVTDCSASILNPAGALLELRAKNIRTLVVGLGEDALTPPVQPQLGALAEAGGFVHSCPGGQSSECGANDTCSPTTLSCGRAFFHAATGAELGSLLFGLTATSAPPMGDLCTLSLDARPSPLDGLRVLINGVAVRSDDPAGGWALRDMKVTFNGALCTRIMESTVYDPLTVELQIFSGY